MSNLAVQTPVLTDDELEAIVGGGVDCDWLNATVQCAGDTAVAKIAFIVSLIP